jgi:predicted nucleotidyltransferase
MTRVFEIADRLVRHAVRRYPDQVDLIVCYGSHIKGTATAASDLDTYYVPASPGAAETLCAQFVFDGLPYDLWPVPWSMLEQISRAEGDRPWSLAVSLISDARILFARDQAARSRFQALQQAAADALKPPARPRMLQRAGASLSRALAVLGRMHMLAATEAAERVDHIRAAHEFFFHLYDAAALVNQRPYAKGYGANHAELLRMPLLPPEFGRRIDAALAQPGAPESLRAASDCAAGLRTLIAAELRRTAAPESPATALRSFYFFVLEYTHKIRSACERSDRPAARGAVIALVNETAEVLARIEPGLPSTSGLLWREFAQGYVSARLPELLLIAEDDDLPALARAAARFDAAMLRFLQTRGVSADVFDDERELQAFLDSRV